jgi:hypothetical protein
MLERARELGFELLVATPHLPEPLSAEYARRVAAARQTRTAPSVWGW